MLADRALRISRRIPGLYSAIAFLFARRVVVHGASMYPTLHPADRVLFDRLAYRVEDPQPGDVVLARHPSRPGVRFIKRVSEGERYWLLGDNPDASTDSRDVGAFRPEDILARARLVYWPRDRMRRLDRP